MKRRYGFLGWNSFASTKRTTIFFNCSAADLFIPFMPLVAAPPEFPGVVCPDIIRRVVSVFGGMPLCREQRMRFGERHKRLLRSASISALAHAANSTVAEFFFQPNSSRPFRAHYFCGTFSRRSPIASANTGLISVTPSAYLNSRQGQFQTESRNFRHELASPKPATSLMPK